MPSEFVISTPPEFIFSAVASGFCHTYSPSSSVTTAFPVAKSLAVTPSALGKLEIKGASKGVASFINSIAVFAKASKSMLVIDCTFFTLFMAYLVIAVICSGSKDRQSTPFAAKEFWTTLSKTWSNVVSIASLDVGRDCP